MAKHYEGLDHHLVELDENSPDRLLARSEPMHPDEQEDYDADLMPIDEGMDVSAAGVAAIPADALRHLLNFLIPAPSHSARKRLRMAQLRLIILAHAAGLDGIGNRPLAALAQELGVTRSLLSLYATRMTDQLGQSMVRGGKSRRSREVYRRTATAAHRRAGHKMNEGQPRELATP